MVAELHASILADKVFFGQRECMKNVKKISKVFVPVNTRESIVAQFEKLNVPVERLDISKEEVSDKLNMEFLCEIFGVKK